MVEKKSWVQFWSHEFSILIAFEADFLLPLSLCLSLSHSLTHSFSFSLSAYFTLSLPQVFDLILRTLG